MIEIIHYFGQAVLVIALSFGISILILLGVEIIMNKFAKISWYFRLMDKVTDKEKQDMYNIIEKYKDI